MPNWTDNVRHIKDGEQVDAVVTSRPDRDNEANIRYLRDRLDASDLGAMAVAFDATVAPEVQVGCAVYWNTTNARFEPALAAVVSDPVSGALLPAPSSDCLGVCSYKHNATLADVVLHGRAAIDLGAFADDPIVPGRYYLSSATPGAMTRQSPAVSVPVLFAAGGGVVYVNPLPRNFLSEHVHYRFDMVCAPAGAHSQPSPNQRHVITSPNAGLPGWLPADHASFGGRAPAGAAFGYNLAMHPELRRLWPPIPVGACSFFQDKGQDYTGATMLSTGPAGLVQADAYGIWWMSDCYGDVPWAVDYDSTDPPGPIPDDTAPPTCPRPDGMRMSIHFAVSLFASKYGLVTSLVSTSPALTIKNLDDVAAKSGDLKLGLDLDLTVAPGSFAGSTVLKEFAGGQFKRGPVVEGFAVGAGLTATADVVDSTNPGVPVYRGNVSVALDPAPIDRELVPQLVRQAGVSDQVANNLPFVVFPGGSQSSALFLYYDVPPAGLGAAPKLQVLTWLLGLASGTIPPLTVSYRRLARPSSGGVALPAADTALTFTTGQAITAFSYVEAASSQFAVAAGDKVLITIARGASDGYSGGLGLLRYSCILGA